MQLRPYPHGHPLVAGILAAGLGVGGAFYAASGTASGPPVAALTGVAAPSSQEEDTPPVLPRDSAGPVLDASSDSGGPVLEGPAASPVGDVGPVAKRGDAPPAGRRVIGEVAAIAADPAAFTVRTQQGDETTYRVLEATVFKAGYDRPYNFGLLKSGDGVNVLGRMEGAGPAGAGRPRPVIAGGAAPKRPRQLDSAEPDTGLVATQVVVRPAGEAPYRGVNPADKPGAAKPGPAKKGASDGAGQ